MWNRIKFSFSNIKKKETFVLLLGGGGRTFCVYLSYGKNKQKKKHRGKKEQQKRKTMAQSVKRKQNKKNVCVWCLHFCHLFSVGSTFFFCLLLIPPLASFVVFSPQILILLSLWNLCRQRKKTTQRNKQWSKLMSNMCLVRLSRFCCCLLLLPCQFVMDGVFHLVVSNVNIKQHWNKKIQQHFKIQKSQPTSSLFELKWRRRSHPRIERTIRDVCQVEMFFFKWWVGSMSGRDWTWLTLVI